jgi:hypothetical protein
MSWKETSGLVLYLRLDCGDVALITSGQHTNDSKRTWFKFMRFAASSPSGDIYFCQKHPEAEAAEWPAARMRADAVGTFFSS